MTVLADWRPRLHFSPARHWINDPNGLIWHDGEYHCFYQHNPFDRRWGHMSWGHAVSTDLLQWRELPVAIPETSEWMAFSGSTVIDAQDCAGLGRAAMVACYTGHRHDGKLQAQLLASSIDRGRSFEPFAGNPVLDIGLAEFRDPKVFWHAACRCWVMLVSLAHEPALAFFHSADLKRWERTSTFTLELPGTAIWECPDLISVPIRGERGRAWVLKFDVYQGHPSGGSGALAIAGDFDGWAFEPGQPPQWIDGGRDFYAAIAFAAMPPGDRRCIWLGWLNDHRYAEATPTPGWCGAMTLPREVQAVRQGSLLRIVQQPVRELKKRRGRPLRAPAAAMAGAGLTLFGPQALPVAHEIEIEIEAGASAAWQLGVLADPAGDQRTLITVDRHRGTIGIDRGASGLVPARGNYLEGRHQTSWAGARADRQCLRVIVDACSVEVFAGDGEAVLTELVFPRSDARAVQLRPLGAGGGRLIKATAWPLT